MRSNLPDSSLLKNIPRNYADSYSASLAAKDLPIEKVGKSFFTATPTWVDCLLEIRNRIVSTIGLKVPGAGTKEEVLRNFNCEVGERVGLFNVIAKTEDEVIFGEDDKHLDFRVSLFLDRQNNLLIVSTIVQIHNWIGSLYLLLIMPFHKLIVPMIAERTVAMLRIDR